MARDGRRARGASKITRSPQIQERQGMLRLGPVSPPRCGGHSRDDLRSIWGRTGVDPRSLQWSSRGRAGLDLPNIHSVVPSLWVARHDPTCACPPKLPAFDDTPRKVAARPLKGLRHDEGRQRRTCRRAVHAANLGRTLHASPQSTQLRRSWRGGISMNEQNNTERDIISCVLLQN